ncbi:MAG: phosphoribosylpyrophosphate synthetase [Cyclobacteriaceae bacterium]|jgi:hypothetical protein|nr:phosphoribosylpyrophosphate synthetase [Cyclobacteriaceae bacterium]
MQTFDTLTEAIDALRKEGYTEDFNLAETCLECRGANTRIEPEELYIDKVYRFEGSTDPDDEMILYAISSAKHKLKGVLVNAYGAYSEPLSEELARKLAIRR